MLRTHRMIVALTAGVLLQAQPLRAQQLDRVSLEATIGGGAGLGGGKLAERGGIALDELLGIPFRVAGRRAIIAIAGGYQGSIAFGDKCQLGGPSGRCLDDFPRLATVGVLVGAEWWPDTGSCAGCSVRVLAGPAYVHLDRYGPTRRGSAPGIVGRVDAATRQLGPLAGVLSLRGTMIPRYRAQTLAAFAIGVGLRLR